jgi:hypothetical protein
MKKVFFLFFIICNIPLAEEIEEAKGLPDEPLVVEAPASTSSTNQNWRHRSYLLLEGISRKAPVSKNEFPNLEADVSTDFKLKKATLFFDGYAKYTEINQKTLGYTNQIGFRIQATESLNFALGKERNRRAPGIIISPSDLLFSQTNLPGLTEDRRGVWLVRGSYQILKSSYDVILLPTNQQTEGGWPESSSKYYGAMARTLQQFVNWDISLSMASLNSNSRVGLALQGIVKDYWKTYFESGYFGNSNSYQHLLGLGYEGSNDYSAKIEYFYNETGLREGPTLFTQRSYAILTASAQELYNKFNLISSVVKSLEDSTELVILRAEYLATNQLVTGITSVTASNTEQYGFDLKYTF